MNKKINEIIENGIIGLLEEYFEWFGEVNDKAQFIFDTLFLDEEYTLSEQGKGVVQFWSDAINNSCTEQEVNLAHKCATTKFRELNLDFYKILPKMFADIFLKIKEQKLQSEPITVEQEVGYNVIDFLGRETLGHKYFAIMVKQEISNKNAKQPNL